MKKMWIWVAVAAIVVIAAIILNYDYHAIDQEALQNLINSLKN